MNRIIFLIIFSFLMCSFSSAQSPFIELEKAKEIKLLETTREEVRKTFADYSLDISDDEKHYQRFSTKNADIEVSYSSGQCSNDSEWEVSEWNVPEWKVTYIEISPKMSLKFNDIGIDYSKYRKERMYANLPRSYIYHNKDVGIAIQVDNDEIETIYLVPPKKYYSSFCDKEKARKYYSSKSWFVDSKLKERIISIDLNYRANVVNLILSQAEIIVDCALLNSTQNKSCSNGIKEIAVLVSAKDPENDVFTYVYKVSGGKIIGRGASVIWDLSGVEAGTYTITAAVDDGGGISGETMTKTVIIKECANCHTNQ